MSVGDKRIVDAARGKGQGAVVHLVPALLQSAVDEDALAAYLQTMAAAGDTLVSAEKLSFMAFVLSSQKVGDLIVTLFPGGGNRNCILPEYPV